MQGRIQDSGKKTHMDLPLSSKRVDLVAKVQVIEL